MNKSQAELNYAVIVVLVGFFSLMAVLLVWRCVSDLCDREAKRRRFWQMRVLQQRHQQMVLMLAATEQKRQKPCIVTIAKLEALLEGEDSSDESISFTNSRRCSM